MVKFHKFLAVCAVAFFSAQAVVADEDLNGRAHPIALVNMTSGEDQSQNPVQNPIQNPIQVPPPTETPVPSSTGPSAPTQAPTPAPSTKAPTPAPSTKAPTPAPSTKAPTPAPSSATPTPAPTTKAPTPAPTTKAPTPAPTTKAPTPAPTTPPPTGPIWVGPAVGNPIDSACWRKTYRTKQCPPGYEFDKVATCWAQCPIEYPVECGMECLPQNADCAKDIIKKASSVVTVGLNAATSGVFGEISKASKKVQQGVKCGQQLFSAVNKVMGYINEVENGGKTDTTKDQLMFLLSKSQFATQDLPVAVSTCLGMPVPTNLDKADKVVNIVKSILEKVLNSKEKGDDVLSIDTFTSLTKDAGVSSVSDLSPADKDILKKLVAAGETCGLKVKSIIDRVVAAIVEMKKKDSKTAMDVIRLGIMNSNLLLKELPEATVGCFGANAPEGFRNRDEILKTVHLVIDRVIEAAYQNGNPVGTEDYAIVIANMGLDAIATFDPTGLANMAKEFVQPICGPTIFVGEIDDGPADKALGLRTVEKAFRGSSGEWKKQGDGLAKITFKSVDNKDVTVNILSGGNLFAKVKVGKGKTVEWSKPLSELQGKTMYMDRWRPGFLGIPGTGGGSLLTWVPMDADGSLALSVQINPTSFSDHALRH